MPLIPPLLDLGDVICGLSTLEFILILRVIRWTKRFLAKVGFEPRIFLSFFNGFIHYITEATVFQRALNCTYLIYHWFCLIHLIYLIRWKCLHFERTKLKCCTYPSPTWWSRWSPSLDTRTGATRPYTWTREAPRWRRRTGRRRCRRWSCCSRYTPRWRSPP